MTVRTEFGSVLAVPHRGSLLFRNVPFAAPPFGPRRFLPPQRPAVWDGLRDGAEPGVGMPQPELLDPLNPYYVPKSQGEDALTLEIQTPELGAAGMPVVVWIHGGGFVRGAGSARAQDGYAFARDGIVHVAINYRLGIDGFLLFDDSADNHADNLGLRDQIAALEWVQRNIAGFGGDPANVTVAGQASGAVCVSYLLAAPAARGLFRRAISQSGGPNQTMGVDDARVIAARAGQLAGSPATVTGMRSLDLDRTREVTGRIFAEHFEMPDHWPDDLRMPLPFCGVTGTEMLPSAVIPAVRAGSSAEVEILAGTTRHQAIGMLLRRFEMVTTDSAVGRDMLRALRADSELVEEYRAMHPEANDIIIIGAIATELWAKRPTVDLVAAHQGVSYLYEFAWESPYLQPGSGAVQGIDIPFANDDFENMLDVPRGARMLGPDPSLDLAKAMHTAFADFVKFGDPGWEPWDARQQSEMRFDAGAVVRS